VVRKQLLREVTWNAVVVVYLAVIAELLHKASDGIAWHLAVGSNVGDRKAGGGVTAVLHNLQNSGRESLVHKFKEYEFNSRNSRKW
jgi:hypothetical protein